MIKHTFFGRRRRRNALTCQIKLTDILREKGFFYKKLIILYLHYNTFISMRSTSLEVIKRYISYDFMIWIFTLRIQTILISVLPQQQPDSGRCNFPLLFDVKYVTACFSYVCFYKQFAAPRYHKTNICALEYLNYLLTMHFAYCIV